MKKQVFGLDISDRSIEALVLTKTIFGKVKISSYARVMLPANIVNNGQIKDPEKLAIKISELLASAQPKPIKTNLCVLSIPESQVFTTIFKLPAGLKRREIINTIPYQAEEVIPFKAGEIYFDFKTISKNDSTQEVFYVAVPISVIDGYIDVLNKINLKPLAFDLESISSARALLNNADLKSPKILLDLGMRNTSLNIFQDQGLKQGLSLPLAGNHLTKAIAKGLNITPKEAEKLKHRLSFAPKTDQEKQALKFVEKELKKIINGAKKLISFFETENHIKIDEGILYGGTSLFSGIDQYFADQLNIKIDIGQPWRGVDNSAEIFKENENKEVVFANVTGLALRGLFKDPVNDDINLLPIKPKAISLAPQKASRQEWRSIYIQLAILAFLILVFGFIFWYRQQADLLGRFFPAVDFKHTQSDFDPQTLDDYRDQLFDQATPSATSSDQTASTTSDFNQTTTTESLPVIATSTASRQIFAPAPNNNLQKVKILPTTLGYVNVRQGPGTSYPKVGQAEVDKIYTLVSEKNGWYEIKLSESQRGWVIATYAQKQQ